MATTPKVSVASPEFAKEISFIFKDTRSNNYFIKQSHHIFISIFVLLMIIGIIIYYKFNSTMSEYKYAKDEKTGDLKWKTDKCLPYMLPIAGQIQKNPGETANEATARNFEECINDLVDTENMTYITPLNMLVEAALQVSGTILKGSSIMLSSFTSLARYFLTRFDGIDDILSRMQLEITSIIKDQIFDKLRAATSDTAKISTAQISTFEEIKHRLISAKFLEYFKEALIYSYLNFTKGVYLALAIISGEHLGSILTGGTDYMGVGGAMYNYKLYDGMAKDIKLRLNNKQKQYKNYGVALAPHIETDDRDARKLLDQQYALFRGAEYNDNVWATAIYNDGGDEGAQENIINIQPMSMENWKKYSKERSMIFKNLRVSMEANKQRYENEKMFHWSDHIFTETWMDFKAPGPDAPDTDLNKRNPKKMGELWHSDFKEEGVLARDHPDHNLSPERIFLPISAEVKIRKNKAHDSPLFDPSGLFIGNIADLKNLSTSGKKRGFYYDARNKTIAMVREARNGAYTETTELTNAETRTAVFAEKEQWHKCITITYGGSGRVTDISNGLNKLKLNQDDKRNHKIFCAGNKLHLIDVEWVGGQATQPPVSPTPL